ncbi:unnamed protein product [Brassica rapa]|uniref:Uncharacterized protein n=1 Tax=Brassica campestris TaxID=3711 RepID=A0A8D9DB57_BRACM|nr:unnamed protein product [Brassica rapa]
MHPSDLEMLETNSGVRGFGGSFRGKSQASSSNTTEASFGLNSQTAEGVQGSKDKDSGAAVDGVNPASGNKVQKEKQKSCALGTVVENGSKKRSHFEAAEDAVCGLIQIICINKTVRYKRRNNDVGNEDEDEDDEDYDYNGWDEFVRNDCERDEDDDFDGCPPKGGRGGRSGRNGYERSVVTKVRG